MNNRYTSIIDPIVSLYRVFHETQMDTAMAVVITTVATVAGAVAHAVKVRIVASFLLYFIFIYFPFIHILLLGFKWHTFRLNYRPHASSHTVATFIYLLFPCITRNRETHFPHLCSFLCPLLEHFLYSIFYIICSTSEVE